MYIKKWRIDALVTFDAYGVSGHANHRAISAGMRKLVASDTIPVYENVSVNLIRKYSGLWDLPYTLVWYYPRILFGSLTASTSGLIVASPSMYMRSRRAFSAHASQYSWDRVLYLLFSRYMYYNELRRVLP
jgi:N-acetylglucosaminylphosphatidylinositol deacetylase